MANCRNCQKYWCEHKYGEILRNECKDYEPHYIDVDIPIEDNKNNIKEKAYKGDI